MTARPPDGRGAVPALEPGEIGLGAPRGSRHSASVIIFLLGRDEEARWHLAAHLRPRRLRVGLISARPKH